MISEEPHPIFRIRGDSVEAVSTQYISSYLPRCIQECIEALPDDVYIVGIGYQETLSKSNKKRGGDAQLGITGHCHKKDLWEEEHRIAAARELGEEIGMIPKDYAKLISLRVDQEDEKKRFKIYRIKSSELRTIEDMDINRHNDKDVKDGKEHVAVVVYGNHIDIINMLKRRRKYINSDILKPADNIDYFIAVSVREAKKMCKIISNRHHSKNYKNIMWNLN